MMKISGKIGVIQFEPRGVRVLLAKVRGRSPSVSRCVFEPFPESGDDDREQTRADTLRRALAALPSAVDAWILCVSFSWVVVRNLRVPFRGRGRVSDALLYEIEPHLAFPVDEVVVDHIPVSEGKEGTDVLAFGLRRAILEEQLACVEAAGIYIDGVQLDALGLAALAAARRPRNEKRALFLHLMEENAALVELVRGKVTAFEPLPLSRHDFVRNPAAAARTLGNALRSMGTPEREDEDTLSLVVTGVPEGSVEPAAFSPGAQVDVEFAGPLVSARALPKEDSGTEAWEALAGAAAASAGSGFSLDFRDGELRGGKPLPGVRARLFVATTLAVAMLAVFAFGRYSIYQRNLAEVARMGDEIAGILADTFPDDPVARQRPRIDVGGFRSFEAMQLASEEEDLVHVALSPEVLARPPLLDILLDLSRRIPLSGITITEMKVTSAKKPEVTIRGEAANHELLTNTIEYLKRSDMLRIDEGRLSRASAGGRETFTIILAY